MGKDIVRSGYVGIIKNEISTAGVVSDKRIFDGPDASKIGAGNSFGMNFDSTADIKRISHRVRRAVVQYSTNLEPVPTLGDGEYGDNLPGGRNWSLSLDGYGDSDDANDVLSLLTNDLFAPNVTTEVSAQAGNIGVIVSESIGILTGSTDMLDLSADPTKKIFIGIVSVSQAALMDLDWGRPRPYTIPLPGRGPLLTIRNHADYEALKVLGLETTHDLTATNKVVKIGLTPGSQHLSFDES